MFIALSNPIKLQGFEFSSFLLCNVIKCVKGFEYFVLQNLGAVLVRNYLLLTASLFINIEYCFGPVLNVHMVFLLSSAHMHVDGILNYTVEL